MNYDTWKTTDTIGERSEMISDSVHEKWKKIDSDTFIEYLLDLEPEGALYCIERALIAAGILTAEQFEELGYEVTNEMMTKLGQDKFDDLCYLMAEVELAERGIF